MTEVNCGKLRQIAPEKFRRTPLFLRRMGDLEACEFHAANRSRGRRYPNRGKGSAGGELVA